MSRIASQSWESWNFPSWIPAKEGSRRNLQSPPRLFALRPLIRWNPPRLGFMDQILFLFVCRYHQCVTLFNKTQIWKHFSCYYINPLVSVVSSAWSNRESGRSFPDGTSSRMLACHRMITIGQAQFSPNLCSVLSGERAMLVKPRCAGWKGRQSGKVVDLDGFAVIYL